MQETHTDDISAKQNIMAGVRVEGDYTICHFTPLQKYSVSKK